MNREDSQRLNYLCYRCDKCGRLLTKIEIVEKWKKWEREGTESKGLCECGSGRITPGNPTLWEELTKPAVWRLWLEEVVAPRLGLRK